MHGLKNRYLAGALSAVLGIMAHDASTGETTKMNPAGAFEFPADTFPILPWGRSPTPELASDPVRGLPSMVECGFNMSGFVSPELLPLCEQYGLKAIVHPGSAGIAKTEWKSLSPEAIDRRIRSMVESIGDSPALVGYYLVDEPGASMFPALGAGVAAVRKHAPGKLAYINLFPGYATLGAPDKSQLETASFAEYLERYVTEVRPQFVSYDDYMVPYSQDLRTRRAATYYADLLEVRRVAHTHGLPFWNICSSNQIRQHTTIPSPANLAFQAYTTLAAGGRGLSWFTYDIGGYGYRPIDQEGRRTAVWQYLQLVNRQVRILGPMMNHLTSTGVFFTAPPPAPGLALLPGRTLKDVSVSVTGTDKDATVTGSRSLDDPPVMVGEFADAAGVPHAMIVNLSLATSILIRPVLHEARAMEWASPVDGHWNALHPEKGVWLVAGQGVLVRIP